MSYIDIKSDVIPLLDKTWTLFLDRDGVINKKRENDYVKNIAELEILPGMAAAIAKLSAIFGRIIIVTNQQGIGKELMTHEDLQKVHEEMLRQITKNGGKIDAIYYAPQLASENSNMRKPQIGMAHKAQEAFPEIDFKKSIMIGDSLSDMEFGDKAGMKNVHITNKDSTYFSIPSLTAFCNLI